MLLLLMSPLRSGSNMVRSMLREDKSISDIGMEHSPVTAWDVASALRQSRTPLIPMKYGHMGFTQDCLEAAALDGVATLLMHRRDARAQAMSLANARVNGTWFRASGRGEAVSVTDEEVSHQSEANLKAFRSIIEAFRGPHAILAYEDVTVPLLASLVGRLLGRDVVVTEPTTIKLS